jgi:DNA polymerase-3 subunit gamma/tau
MSGSEKYRPKTFNEVIGQPTAVEYLRERCRNEAAERIILHGPVGCGKTALARNFAKVLLCEGRHSDSADACGECIACREFRPNRFEIDCAQFGQVEHARDIFSARPDRPPIRDKRYIQIFDEAQGNSSSSQDGYLKLIENAEPWEVFIFCTSDVDRLNRALQSRCQLIALMKVPAEILLKHARHILECERFEIEEGALRLIVDLADGQVRDLVVRLETACSGVTGIVTEAHVREINGLNDVDAAMRYLSAALSGRASDALGVLKDWEAGAAQKRRAIFDVITSVRLRDVMMMSGMTGLADHCQERDRRDVAARVDDFALNLGAAADEVWSRMAAYWETRAEQLSKSGLSHMALEFQRTVSHWSRARVSSTGRRAAKPRTVRRTSGHSRASGQLSRRQVKDIVAAASFLPQEHGRLLNARITVDHHRLGTTSHPTAFTTELKHELGLALARWDEELRGRFDWIFVHEQTEEGLFTTIVCRIPEHLTDRALSWLHDDFLRRRFGEHGRKHLRIRIQHERSRDGAVRRHWALVRMLCRGVDPGIEEHDGRRIRPLADLLEIPTYCRPKLMPPTVTVQLRVSQSMGDDARKKAEQDGLTLLSAFRDRAWGHLYSGWELLEFEERQQLRRVRRQLEEVGTIPGNVAAGAAGTGLWPKDPRDRRRSWKIWAATPRCIRGQRLRERHQTQGEQG